MPIKTKVMFVPFYREMFRPTNTTRQYKLAGDEFTGQYGKNARWKQVMDQRRQMVGEDTDGKAKIVDMHQVVADGNEHAIIKNLGATDQIYIRGHCMTGLESIFSFDDLANENCRELRKVFDGFIEKREKPPKAEVLPALIVANRLIASGLQQSWTGAIKCFNCHSGEPVDGLNFSRAFVTHLHKRGYDKCTVFGYVGALDSFAGANNWAGHEHGDDVKKMHTYSTADIPIGFEGKTMVKVLGRAKANRIEAKPYGS